MGGEWLYLLDPLLVRLEKRLPQSLFGPEPNHELILNDPRHPFTRPVCSPGSAVAVENREKIASLAPWSLDLARHAPVFHVLPAPLRQRVPVRDGGGLGR